MQQHRISSKKLLVPSGKRSHSDCWNDIPAPFLIGNTSTQSGAPIFQPAMLVDPGVYFSPTEITEIIQQKALGVVKLWFSSKKNGWKNHINVQSWLGYIYIDTYVIHISKAHPGDTNLEKFTFQKFHPRCSSEVLRSRKHSTWMAAGHVNRWRCTPGTNTRCWFACRTTLFLWT